MGDQEKSSTTTHVSKAQMVGDSQEELDSHKADPLDELYLWSAGNLNGGCGWQKIGSYDPLGGVCPDREPGAAGTLQASKAFSLRDILHSGHATIEASSPDCKTRARRRHTARAEPFATSAAA